MTGRVTPADSGDRLDRDALVALLDDHAQRGVDQLLSPFSGAIRGA